MPRTSTTVGSRIDDSGNLEFHSKVSGDNLLELDGTNDLITFGSGATVVGAGPRVYAVTRTDVDAQNLTLAAAAIAGGIIVHTSVTGGGTATFDTAANIIAAIPALATLGNAYDFKYYNDGDQTVTFANDAGPSVTIVDTGQTAAINESALITLVNTGAGALAAYILGA